MFAMPLTEPTKYGDKTSAWLEVFNASRRQALQRLLSAEVVEEHASDPRGARRAHSPELQEILNYLRMSPISSKLFAYARVPHESFGIGAIAERGSRADILDDGPFSTEREAVHAVFLKRLAANGLKVRDV